MLRKVLVMFLSVVLTIGMLPMTAFAEGISSFDDTVAHWAQAETDKWAGRDLIKGYEGDFRPDDPISRAEMVVLADRLMGYQVKENNNFTDLENTWYTDAILRCAYKGIVEGYDGKVYPEAAITRQEAVVLLSRMIGLDADMGETGYKDDKSIAGWAKGYVEAFGNLGYIQGRPGNVFNPEAAITRAEVVTVIDHMFAGWINSPGTVSGDFSGNVVINTTGVTLKNATVEGNLILAEGIKDGEAYLDGVHVLGDVYVYGGGEKSAYFNNTRLDGGLYVAKEDGDIRIVVSGDTDIQVTTLASGAILVEQALSGGGFQSVIIPASDVVGASFMIEGTITSLDVGLEGAKIILTEGTVLDYMEVNAADVEITSQGQVTTLTVGDDIVGTIVDGMSVDGGTSLEISVPEKTSSSSSGSSSGAANSAPTVANPIADQVGQVGVFFDFAIPSVTFSDSDGDTLTYSVDQTPEGLTFSGSIFSGTPTAEGTITVVVTATDGNGGSETDRFDITINPASVNTAPIMLNSQPPLWGRVGEFLTIQLDIDNFMDPDGDSLTYAINQAPPGVSYSVDTFIGTPTETGISNISLRVRDDNGGSLQTDFDFIIGDATDLTSPAAINLLPADDEGMAAVDTDIRIQFDEAVVIGTGSLRLRDMATNEVVESYTSTSEALSTTGDTVTIDRTADLSQGTGYYIEVDAGMFEDLSRNIFMGISGDSGWNFMTESAPNHPPTVLVGEESQSGMAVTEGEGGIPSAVGYSADVSGWFEDQEGTSLSYSLVTAKDTDTLADVSGYVSIVGTTLTYTAALAQEGHIVEIVVKANDGIDDSTGNVTISVSVESARGSGTERDPYKVSYIEELAKIGSGTDGWDMGDHYILANDLDFNNPDSYKSKVVDTAFTSGSGFTPIGTYSNYPYGSFDGDGNTIANLYIKDSDLEMVGLFGYSYARIKNVHLSACDVTGKQSVGMLLGGASGGSVENCSVQGVVSGNRVVGGLVGTCYSCNLINNKVAGTVNCAMDLAGGLAASISGGFNVKISDNAVSCDVTGVESVGGLTGSCNGPEISQSYSTGDVIGNNTVGGLIGYIYGTTVIRNCYALGDVEGERDVSGLIANIQSASLVENCYALGNIMPISGAYGLIAISYDGATLRNSIAFSQNIDGWGTRVIGINYGTSSNNYGYTDMLIDGSTVEESDSNGMNISLTDFKSPATYKAGGMLDAWLMDDETDAIWEIKSGAERPTLIGVGDDQGLIPDKSGPKVLGLSPGNGATDVPVTSNIVIDFDEAIHLGSGNLEVRLASDNSIVETHAADNSGVVSVAGERLTIDRSDLWDESTEYYINMAEGFVTDNSGNMSSPITGLSEWAFTSGITPAMHGDGLAEGTAFEIVSIDDLLLVGTNATYPLSAYYKLMNNLDFENPSDYESGLVDDTLISGSGFDPVGNYVADNSYSAFTGQFDGQGYTISNLYINRSKGLGLFAITQTASLKNIHLTNFSISGSGGRIGSLAGKTVNSNVENCSAKNGVVAKSGTYGSDVGGLIGQAGGSVSNCWSKSMTVSGHENVGGLLGGSAGTVSECYVLNATVYGDSGANDLGGLIGYMYSSSTTNDSYAVADVTGDTELGGLVGTSDGRINHCYATEYRSGITGTGNIGGILGYQYGNCIIQNSIENIDSISGNYDTNRILGKSNSFAVLGLNKNYGQNSIGNSSDDTGVDGKNLGTEDFKTWTFYTNTENWTSNNTWSPSVWEMGTTRPILRNTGTDADD